MKTTHRPYLLLPMLLAVLLFHPAARSEARAQEDDEEAAELLEAEEERFDLVNMIAEAHFEKASLLEEEGRIDDAIGELAKIRKLPFPEGEEVAERLFEVDVTMAEMYLEAERPRQAEALLENTLKRFVGEPRQLAELHILMGRAKREQGKQDEALKHFNLAIEAGQKALAEPVED